MEVLSTALTANLDYSGDSPLHLVVMWESLLMSVQNKIKKICSDQMGLDKVSVNDRLVDDLGMDSLDVVEFIINCEREFGVLPFEFEPTTIKSICEMYT